MKALLSILILAGGVGTPPGVSITNNGVAQGRATTIDCDGPNIDCLVSGSVSTITTTDANWPYSDIISVSEVDLDADFDNIQDAIDSVPQIPAAGATILIGPGQYDEQLTIENRSVHLVGLGRVVIAKNVGAWVDDTAVITVTDGAGANGQLIIENIAVEAEITSGSDNNLDISAIKVDACGSGCGLTVIDSTIECLDFWSTAGANNSVSGITALSTPQQISITNTTILSYITDGANSDAYGIRVGGSSSMILHNVDIDAYATSFTLSEVAYGIDWGSSGTVTMFGGSIEVDGMIPSTINRTAGTVALSGVTGALSDDDTDADNTTTFTKNLMGVVQTDGQDEQYKLNLRNITGDVATPGDGDVWYNNTTDKLRTRQNGVSMNVVASAGGNFVEVTVDFGSGGAEVITTTVTGQSWVTTSSVILCSPTLFATADRVDGNEELLLEGLKYAVLNRVNATGFDLMVMTDGDLSSNDFAYGKFLYNCTGS